MTKMITAKVVVTCDVLIDDHVYEAMEREINSYDEDNAANQVLYAFLNPKIDVFNDEEAIEGHWDNICSFKGNLKNFKLEISS